jgi:hypothetical protein
VSKRRGSRLFSGQPGLLLVSEDIPGITMPAPPVNVRPLEDEAPEFDLSLFHKEEDLEAEESGSEGPLRLFLGGDEVATPAFAEDDDAIFDVSALAMPEGPDGGLDDELGDDRALRFMDESEDFEADDLVQLAGAPPPVLSMGVSAEVSLDEASSWDDNPTQPGPPDVRQPTTAVIRDSAPVVSVEPVYPGDPVDVPAADPFEIDDPAASFGVDDPTAVAVGAPAEVLWDEDDTGFFDSDPGAVAGLPTEPPRLMVDGGGESRTFRVIPDKEDPPILPLLVILIGIVIMSIALWLSYPSEDTPEASRAVSGPPTAVAPTIQPAPRTESRGQVSEVAANIGFISVHADKPANIYVDDRKVGITPIIKAEVLPGAHRVLAVEVETGKRKAVTADVERGGERRVGFTFQPVQ